MKRKGDYALARPYNKYRVIGYGVGKAIKTMYKGYRSYKKYSNKKNVKSGNGVTSQYDKTLQYRKKRMPRRKRKSWKKFVTKVRRAMEKDFGKTTVVFNHLQSAVTGGIVSAATDQGRSECHLYGLNGIVDTSGVTDGISGARDIRLICDSDTRIGASTKVKFCSGVLDVTFRAVSTGVELDVYELEYSKETEAQNVIDMLNNGFVLQQATGYTNQLALLNRGVTLFDCPQGISVNGIKILKKMKYFIPVNNTATYQIRDPKTHIFDASDIDSVIASKGLNKRKYTRSLFYIWKSLPGDATVATMSIGVTRKYSYQIMDDGNDYDGRN